MDIATGTTLALSILSFILAVISIVVAVITVRQNNKMIEASSRPYITVTAEMTNFGSPMYYLVLKNYGQTGARITKWASSFDLSVCGFGDKITPFKNIEGTFLAPGQSIVCAVDYEKLKAPDLGQLEIDIEYQSETKCYSSKCPINTIAYADLVHARSNSSKGELKNISYTLQDLVEKIM